MEQMESTDREIQKLAERMNTTSGEQQLDAMKAVINKLLEQRSAMHQKMLRGRSGSQEKPAPAEKDVPAESGAELSETQKP